MRKLLTVAIAATAVLSASLPAFAGHGHEDGRGKAHSNRGLGLGHSKPHDKRHFTHRPRVVPPVAFNGRLIDDRQASLMARINSSLTAGRITRAEADLLLAREAEIAFLEAQLRASDSRLTPKEGTLLLARLNILQRLLGREIADRF